MTVNDDDTRRENMLGDDTRGDMNSDDMHRDDMIASPPGASSAVPSEVPQAPSQSLLQTPPAGMSSPEAPQAPLKRTSRWRRTTIEYTLIIVCAIGLALLIQAYGVKPYRIPSESMTNTLKIGDRVLVNRVVYHLRKPHRGDVVVFNSRAVGITLIKRIIGLPGETVSLKDGAVYINGRRIKEPYVREVNGAALPTEPFSDGRIWSLEQPYTVPAGHYFVMGDNREQSDDSRDWGPIAKSELIGVAFFKYWPPSRIGGL